MTEITTITCAFCKGKGKDPFGIMSKDTACQVCGGRGKVAVVKPYAKCAHCQGTGISPYSRNVCTTCNGRGVISVTDGKKVCSECKGSGRAEENDLPCTACGGRGIV